MKLTQPDVKIKTSKQFVIEFMNYLTYCEVEKLASVFTDKFTKCFIEHHIKTLIEKLAKNAFKLMSERADKKTTISINYAERLALSKIFAIHSPPPEISNIEYQILNKLVLN